jgi:NADH-quinone oxidoreductase subunit G
MANEAPTITIDGRAIAIQPGKTVIGLAHEAGIDVPHYCYHPGLSIAGNCRICMVEVQGNPRPQIACKLSPQPGMVVHTQSDLARAARASVMEFLLVNHPLDCPICDQAGECHLQEYSYQFGAGRSASTTEKTHLPKNVPFGERIVYDAERCIKCTLCVRFMDEVAKTPDLAMANRSDHEVVVMTAKGEFSTPYAMNIVDICPVGALTSRDFRFKSRLWFMDFTPSICTGCARGCNVLLGGRQGRFLRMEPRFNPAVNQWWMCDAGRLDYKFVNAATRVRAPRVREGDAWREATWEDTIRRAAVALGAARAAGPGHVLLDGNAGLEEMAVGQRLAGHLGGAARFAAATGPGDDFLVVAEKGANARGAVELGLARAGGPGPAAVLVVERDANVPAALRDATGAVVVFAADLRHVPASAEAVFPYGTWAERDGLLVNVDGIVQEIRRAADIGPPDLVPAVEILEEILLELDPSYEVLGRAGIVAALAGGPRFAGRAVPEIGAGRGVAGGVR